MKRLLLMLSLLMLLPSYCFAEFFCTQRGDTDIFVVRNNYKTVLFDKGYDSYIEFQRIINYKDKDKILIHISTFADYDTIDISEPEKALSFPLQEIPLTTDFITTEGKVDKWFIFNRQNWEKLLNEKDFTKVNLIFHTKDKKDFIKKDKRINIRQVLKITDATADELKSLKQTSLVNRLTFNDFSDDLYYKQPYFSIFFPGKTYKEIKERFCYNLNVHTGNGKIDYSYYPNQYTFDDKRKTLGFKTIDFDGKYEGRNFIWFVENSKGTYLNYIPNVPNGRTNNGINWLPCYDQYPIREIYHTFNTIRITYEELYGYNSYGFTLKKYKSYDDNNIRIKEIVNPTLLAILEVPKNAAKKSNYRIKAVNGKSTENMNGLEYDMLTVYNLEHKPITFTFYNTKTKLEKTITIKPTVFYFKASNINYAAINAMNDNVIMERKTPLDFCVFECPSDNIFDPYTSSSENIVQY